MDHSFYETYSLQKSYFASLRKYWRMQDREPTVNDNPHGKIASDASEGLRALSESMESAAAPVSNPLTQDPELVQDFCVEAREHLAKIEACLHEIEQGMHTQETLHEAFRSFHKIKALAGFLNYALMQHVAHECWRSSENCVF